MSTFTQEDEELEELLGMPQAMAVSRIAFSSPLRPEYCAECLHGAWMRIWLSPKYEDVLPAAFNFIVFGRTEAQMTSLVNAMSECRCRQYPNGIDIQSVEEFHDEATDALPHPSFTSGGGLAINPTHLHSLMDIVSDRLLKTLQRISPVKLAKLKGQQEWPASLDDIILPTLGPEGTVRSLEQWISFASIGNPWPIHVLGMIASICTSLIFPAILSSPTLIPTIVRIAGEICDDAALHLSPRYSKAKLTRTTAQLLWRLSAVTTFLHSIFNSTGGAPGMLDDLSVQLKTSLVRMSARVIEMLRSPLVVQHSPEEDHASAIRIFKMQLTLFLDVSVEIEGIDPALLQESAHDVERVLLGSPLKILPLLLVGWKRTLRCYAMSCEESLQTADTFKRCSTCKVVSYCGPECQRRAWRDHKPLCKTLVRVTRDGGGDISSEAFTWNCDAGKVNADDAQEVVAAYSAWRSSHGRVHL
ncbi:hypothetical protein B0H16DRAFT_1521053 [Mycena metata]|uniref:MYND-type domain-containing protein n=1 Tax=Mycena metata TaxID=1033252 RepID=A0AAD7NM82_9AGAR|nr:hypothetical protein B0H16DRAFT_1521053 [Mycena metata]